MIPQETFAIGIDVGGTSIKTGAVSAEGQILDHIVADVNAVRRRRVENLVQMNPTAAEAVDH